MERVFLAVAPDGHVHIFRGVLRRAGAETVQTEGVFIVAALCVVVLASGVELAENELPIVALFLRVPRNRTAAALVLDLDGAVRVFRQRNNRAVTLARLVYGV